VRQAVLVSVGGRALADDPGAAGRLRAWLAVQRAPLAPDTVRDVDGGVRVGYRLVADPDSLVTAAGGR
jgi:hypothetical protein